MNTLAARHQHPVEMSSLNYSLLQVEILCYIDGLMTVTKEIVEQDSSHGECIKGHIYNYFIKK